MSAVVAWVRRHPVLSFFVVFAIFPWVVPYKSLATQVLIYGLFALGKLNERVAALEAELQAARDARERTERHVALMRPESLDRDMIDERARQALNMADAKDIVIFLAPSDRRAPR